MAAVAGAVERGLGVGLADMVGWCGMVVGSRDSVVRSVEEGL